MTHYSAAKIAAMRAEYGNIMEKYRKKYYERMGKEFRANMFNCDVTDFSIREDNVTRILFAATNSPVLAIITLLADELVDHGFAELICQEMLIVYIVMIDSSAPVYPLCSALCDILRNDNVCGIEGPEKVFREEAMRIRSVNSYRYRNSFCDSSAMLSEYELRAYFHNALSAAILRTRLDGFTENLMHPLLDNDSADA